MRFFYFYPFENIPGVEEKVNWQIQSLGDLGINCIAYFIFSGSPPRHYDGYIQTVEIPNSNCKIKIVKRIQKELFILNFLKDQISSLGVQDILYMRIPYPSPFLSRILSRPRDCKIVIEYQNIEPAEYISVGKYWYLVIDYFFGDDIRRYSDAIVGVTDEITNYELHRSGNDKPHITIGNGYNVGPTPLRDLPEFSNNTLDLLCVANVSPWHGLDRLIRGLAMYDGPLKVVLHIAGGGEELHHLKQIASDLGIEDQVIFHGYQTGTTLERLFSDCHVAVGTLGIHRKGMTQGCDLKSRLYCTRGIPFIIACDDPDIPDDFPYTLRVPPDESPVCIEKIVEFAKNVYLDPQHPQKMRAYAQENLDWSVKMSQLNEFFEMLIADNVCR